MLVKEFLTWWYGHGWTLAARDIQHRIEATLQMFSAPTLLRTLFAPWRRIITYPDASFDQRMRALGDNIVSRGIGFVIRFVTLLLTLFAILLVGVFGGLIVLLWPFLPFSFIILLVAGLIA